MIEKKNVILLIIAIILVIVAGYYVYDVYKTASNPNSPISNNGASENSGDFVVFDKDKNEIRLSDYKERPVIMVFWQTSARDSVEMLKLVDSYYEKYKDTVEFLMISISDDITESISTVESFLNFEEISIPVCYDLDGTASFIHNVTELPTMICINEEGNIINEKKGIITEDALEANLDILSNNI